MLGCKNVIYVQQKKKGPKTELCGIPDKTGKNNEMHSAKCFDTVWSNNLHVKL